MSMPRTAVDVSCDACGTEIAVALTVVNHPAGPVLVADDDADLVLARLFATTHRGPFRLAGQPL